MEKRLAKGVTANYSSFEELAKAYGVNTSKRTKNENKLTSQRERFLGACRVCSQPLSYLGGNVMACANETCKGFAVKSQDKEGNEIVTYKPVYRLLDEYAETIATNLFDD